MRTIKITLKGNLLLLLLLSLKKPHEQNEYLSTFLELEHVISSICHGTMF